MTDHAPRPTASRPPVARKPFLAISSDIDDDAIEQMAKGKGVPALTPIGRTPAVQPAEIAEIVDDTSARDAVPPGRVGEGRRADHRPPTPRSRLSYVKARIPDYALVALKTRALEQEVSLNHLILLGLNSIGITIHDADMIEDGRRLRGRNAALAGTAR